MIGFIFSDLFYFENSIALRQQGMMWAHLLAEGCRLPMNDADGRGEYAPPPEETRVT
ncbi:hypothetical protein EDWATA_00191 [Edwardsiella tarda ATCC 23685]|uniref:Uncharacterized protein n=1 Tax=Edwardsiella tarda ATCC 23685 TaxID=500638 RepID=D4F0G7_EDWTA|nr:hypothetical protein EDWATA_00191 [Edwardsiella tarda ATCC 23685]